MKLIPRVCLLILVSLVIGAGWEIMNQKIPSTVAEIEASVTSSYDFLQTIIESFLHRDARK
jgi:hypothetical protein